MKEAIQQVGNDSIDVSSKGFTVYHRTGRGMAPSQIAAKINTIIATGFKPGGGDMYGRGMYTTLNMKSQMNSSPMMTMWRALMTLWKSRR